MNQKAGRKPILSGGFRPKRRIRQVAVRIRGRLLRVGDVVRILRPGYSQGEFRGRFHTGKLVVCAFGVKFQTTLFLAPCEIEIVQQSKNRQLRTSESDKSGQT